MTATSLSNLVLGSSASQSGSTADKGASYVEDEPRRSDNERIERNILQDSRNGDELASGEIRPAEEAASDLARSIVREA